MCGLAGFWQRGGFSADEGHAIARCMGNTIVHRGPDDSGEFADPDFGVALAFRRLSIIDLTPLGHQPMHSANGRFVIVFNGEIYNHKVLRAALEKEGVVFRGRSDTETLCEGFARWGVHETLERTAGMFGIAAWDRERKVLSLARDRMGIKPLYCYSEPGYVSFGSEIKVLEAGPRFRKRVNERALNAYLATLYVPGPETILQDVIKVDPGTLIEISDPNLPLPAPTPFWSLTDAARRGRMSGTVLSANEVEAAVRATVTEVVSSHMEADVPLGAFLSGGIDSTTVVSVMQQLSSTPVLTYTVQFDDPVHDESEHAAAIAAHLGTSHTTIPVNGDDALKLVPDLCEIYDEPFADSSQLPSLLVSAAARKHVTVVLTGDGGDELFAGYNRYLQGRRLLEGLNRVPRPLRRGLGRLIGSAGAGQIDGAVSTLSSVIAPLKRTRLVEQKVRKLGRLLDVDSAASRYYSLTAVGATNPSAQLGELPAAIRTAFGMSGSHDVLDSMLLADQLSYLTDNQMTKMDRASMAVGLEARVPLLDHRLVELSWRLPSSSLVNDGLGKWPLRELAYSYVPRALLDRPKTGFSVPLGPWLRGPLRPWVEQLLSREHMANSPVDHADVQRSLKRLTDGFDDAAPAVWAYANFESWRARWL